MRWFIRKLVDRAVKVTLIVLGASLPVLASVMMIAAYSALMESLRDNRFDADADVVWYFTFIIVAFVGYVAFVVPRIWLKTFVVHTAPAAPRVMSTPVPVADATPLSELDRNHLSLERFLNPDMQEAMAEQFGADPAGEAAKEYKDWRWQQQVKRIPRPRGWQPPEQSPPSGKRYITLRDGFLSPVYEGQRAEQVPVVSQTQSDPDPAETVHREMLLRTVSEDGTVLEVYSELIDPSDEELVALLSESAA